MSAMTDETCTFCRIVNDRIGASVVYRDEHVVAFHDIHPVAPTHILIVPVKHIASLNDLQAGDEPLLTSLLSVAQKLARQEKLDRGGYRLVLNTGVDGGQSVFHLHIHLIGGRHMHWPPG